MSGFTDFFAFEQKEASSESICGKRNAVNETEGQIFGHVRIWTACAKKEVVP
jgi:hypothetical protein